MESSLGDKFLSTVRRHTVSAHRGYQMIPTNGVRNSDTKESDVNEYRLSRIIERECLVSWIPRILVSLG